MRLDKSSNKLFCQHELPVTPILYYSVDKYKRSTNNSTQPNQTKPNQTEFAKEYIAPLNKHNGPNSMSELAPHSTHEARKGDFSSMWISIFHSS